jgi:glycerol transport system ATP-binding protein
VRKQGGHVVLSDAVAWPAKAGLRELPDGPYVVGIRPHHISPVANGAGAARIDGKVQISELSGSESTIHFVHAQLNWVSQSHGMHAVQVGTTSELYIDVDRCMYFSPDGRLVAA